MDALVTWIPNTDDTVTYEVFHGYAPSEYFESALVTHPTAQKSYTGLDDFKAHHFAVRAKDAANNVSAPSPNVTKRQPHRLTMK